MRARARKEGVHDEATCLVFPRHVSAMAKDLAFVSPCCTRTGLSSTWAPVLPRAATTAVSASFDSPPHRTTVAIDRGNMRHTPTALLLLAAASPGVTRGIASMALGGRRLKRPRWKSLFERGMPHHRQTDLATPSPTAAAAAAAAAAAVLQQAPVELTAPAPVQDAPIELTAAAPAAAPAPAAQQTPVELAVQCLPLPVVLLQRTGWPRCGAECAAPAAEAALAAGQSGWGRPAHDFLKGLVHTEAFLSVTVLVAAPLLLRSWAKMEAEYHDTLECRTVVQTYLVAAGGWLCAVLAEVAGNTVLAALLQVAWRVAGARSLWTWSDLGKNLRNTPGWLHASTARWRTVATCLALAGAASRVLALLVGIKNVQPIALALSSPTVKLLPSWLLTTASRPDNQFGLSASQLGVGFGLYVWISYYLCAFLPYRLLYDEYQSFPRRVAQFWKDLDNGQEHNVILSTKLGPEFPKHLKRRMAKMPPGDDREFLRLVGTVRQMSCSHTVVQAAMMKKNKQGKYGVKMTRLEPGDLRYWGSDIFQRLEQQERRDKQTGWKRPEVAGTGKYKYNRAIYARIMREIKVQLGKSDEEMETDPLLSTANLMRFDPDAEEGEFDLIMQKKGAIDAEKDNIRMKGGGHEMVIRTDSSDVDRLKEAGMPLEVEDEWSEQFEFDAEGNINHKDRFSYKSDDTAGQALETSIRSQASKKAPMTQSTQERETLRQKDGGAIDPPPTSNGTSSKI